MNSQTARRPVNQRPNRPNRAKRYHKQTAHVEARRDGKPLIFGWGGHLSITDKNKLRRRATWSLTILVAAIIVAVVIGFWINISIIVPGLTITSVNGHAIPQSQYRKLVALKTQLELNHSDGPHGLLNQRTDLEKQIAAQQKLIDQNVKTVDDLNKQIAKLPKGPSTQRTQLNTQLTTAKTNLTTAQTKHDSLNTQLTNLTQNTIPLQQQSFTQSQIGNDSGTWLQDDELIREWLTNQNAAVRNQIQPTNTQISRALNDLKANLPTSGAHKTTYDQFLSRDNVSNDDVVSMVTLKVRRDNMQNYLASHITSPLYQVSARSMTIATKNDAAKVLAQLKKGGDFIAIAKKQSVDNATNTKGGYLGWLAKGQYTQTEQQGAVDNWLFDPARTIDELSPVISENGAFHILQILAIDPARVLDNTSLQALKTNALVNWSFQQRALPNMNVTPLDQNMLIDPNNMPTDLPSGAPSQQTQQGGQPAIPGGQPSIPGGQPVIPGQ